LVSYPVIESLTGRASTSGHACRVRGVSESGYYAWKERPPPATALRRLWLAGEITDVHRASGGVYGSDRVTAELRFGRSVFVGRNAVADIMCRLGLRGLRTRRLPWGARVGNQRSIA